MKQQVVREALVAALERRAAQCSGAAREHLENRLRALRITQETPAPELMATPEPEPRAHVAGASATRGPLGVLADTIAARHAQAEPDGESQTPLASAAVSRRELGTLREFRGAWSRLFAEQRVRQTLAHVPSQAGPLNSHHLVHRALATMQEVSPAYLQRFVTHVDTLLWLEHQLAPPPTVAARSDKRRKGGVR